MLSYRNGTVQLLVRTKILDHQVRFWADIVLVFIHSHCYNLLLFRSRSVSRH